MARKTAKINKQDVYNLSVGGYGPPQYYYLLKSKALKLNPSLIMAGFYFGNDVFDSYKFVYEIDYWKYLDDRISLRLRKWNRILMILPTAARVSLWVLLERGLRTIRFSIG